MPVNQKGTPDSNTQEFTPPPNPHTNDGNEFSDSVVARDSQQKKADAKVLRQHNESMAEVDRQHNKAFRQKR